MQDNRLAALPASFTRLTNLERLNLSNNRLTALPEFIGRLTSLVELHLDVNRITAIPRSIGQLDRLSSITSASVSAQFKAQLESLLAVIGTTMPHYIRCLKPNDRNVPAVFDRFRIVDQLSCGGVLEAVS